MSDWQWYGAPLHFICSDRCRFHMGTLVNGHVVSTVGDMRLTPDGEAQTIGLGRLFETMVFRATGKAAACGCCPGIADLSEVDMEGYNDAAAAQAGHMAMCHKYEAIK